MFFNNETHGIHGQGMEKSWNSFSIEKVVCLMEDKTHKMHGEVMEFILSFFILFEVYIKDKRSYILLVNSCTFDYSISFRLYIYKKKTKKHRPVDEQKSLYMFCILCCLVDP